MLGTLLTKGALAPNRVDELLRAPTKDSAQINLNIASLYKDRNLLDMLLREVSLCDSINNSLSFACQSEAHSEESYLSLYELLEGRLDELEETEECISKKIDKENYEERRAPKRPRRYLRNYEKKSSSQKANQGNPNPACVSKHNKS